MMRTSRWVMSLLTITVLAVAMVSGQVVQGSVIGVITDATGGALPGVAITATSPALQVPQIVRISEGSGEYRIPDLPPGEYLLTYELSGFSIVVREGIRITSGFNAQVNVTMPLGDLSESITVTGESPVVDIISTRGGTSVSQELLQSTPNTGTMQDLFAIAGGVRSRFAPIGGARGVRSIMTVVYSDTYGQRLLFVVDQSLDGVITYPNQLPDLGSTDEMEVRTSGNTSEVGSPGQSTVLIIKSGGDQFTGRFTENFQSHNWEANNIDDRLRAQGIGSGSLDYLNDASFALGGYIVPQKLWFYGSYHDQRNKTFIPGFSLDRGPDGIFGTLDDTPAANVVQEPVPTIKLSYLMTPNHRLIGLYTQNEVIESAFTGNHRFTPFEGTHDYRQPFPTTKIEWQGTFGSKLFVSMIGSKHSIGAYRNPQPCCADLVSTLDLDSQQRTGSVWSALRGWRLSTRYQQSTKMSYYPNLSHELTVGYYFLPEVFRVNLPVAASGDYLLVYRAGVAEQLRTRNTPVDGLSYQTNMSVYASDVWRPTNRLTLNLGLRWDRFTANVPGQTKAVGPWPFAATGAFPDKDVADMNNLAPRLGVAFDLLGDGTTALKATYGVYNHRRVYGWVGQFNPNYISETRYRWTDPTGCNCYVPGTVDLDPNGADVLSVTGSATTVVNPDLGFDRTHELTASLDRELPLGMAVRFRYVYKRQNGMETRVNVLRPFEVWDQEIIAQDPGPDGTLGSPDDGAFVSFSDFDPAFRGSDFSTRTLVNAPEREHSWHNVEWLLEKRLSDKWFATTSFLLTKNHEWRTAIVQTPNDLLFPLNETWTWMYRFSGGYTLPADINLAASVQLDNGVQGQRTVRFRSPTSGTQNLPVESVSTYGSANTLVHLKAAKYFEVSRGHRLGVEANIYNLLNSNSEWSRNFISGSTFGYATSLIEPRILRLGLSYAF